MHNNLDVAAVRDFCKAGRVIPFIGAGLSMQFKLPSWDQLMDILAAELDWEPAVFKLGGNHLQLAEYYVAVKGSIGPLRSLMDRLFDPSDEEIKNSRSHMALTEIGFRRIYTTNFDNIIERSFKQKGHRFHVVSNLGDISSAPRGVVQIVKFHGTFTDDDSLVLTETNYFERLEFESPLDIKLRADILGRSLLFIGYSLNDINIRYMLYRLHKLRNSHHRLTEELPTAILLTFSPGEVQRALLSNWGVTTIELDPLDKTRSTAEFLEALI